MSLGEDELACYDTNTGTYLVEKGEYEIMVGPSSEDSGLLKKTLTVR
jgi:hypothetical protein